MNGWDDLEEWVLVESMHLLERYGWKLFQAAAAILLCIGLTVAFVWASWSRKGK